MLLYGERPRVAEPPRTHVGRVVPDVEGRGDELPRPDIKTEQSENHDNSDEGVERGPDTESTPRVEGAETYRLGTDHLPQQNRRNQISQREHEEDQHAREVAKVPIRERKQCPTKRAVDVVETAPVRQNDE